MAFDPDAYLAGAKGSGGFDPDAYLASLPAPPDVSKLESFARGGVQGLTFGFADEVQGIADYLLAGRDYVRGRDEARAKNKAAQEANPWTYAGGDVAGGVATAFVPGLNIAKGATMATRIGKSALLGAVSGAGYSEGQGMELFEDALKGGAIGTVGGIATEGVGRLIGNAPKRAEDRLIQGITEGAKPSIAEKLVGAAGARRPEVLEFIQADKALAKAARSGDTDKLVSAVEATSKRLNDARDIFYTAIDNTGERIPVTDMMKRLEAVRKGLEGAPETAAQAKTVWGTMNDVWSAWETKGAVTARELRKTVSGLQEDARSYYRAVLTGGVPPDVAAGKKLAADSLRDLLHEYVETAARKHNLPGVATLKDLNKKLSIVADIEDAAATRATREAKVPPHRLGWMADVAMGVTEPVALIAKKVLVDSGLTREAAMLADDVLAAWVKAAQKGARGAELKTIAAQLGIGAAAADALGLWAQQHMPNQPGVEQP